MKCSKSVGEGNGSGGEGHGEMIRGGGEIEKEPMGDPGIGDRETQGGA